ncbi:MAG: LacI family transcriptional regulator, partial [Ignavibacteriales bacterium]
MKKMKNPGIKDIAQLANVSIGTVDRVLHNRGRVSQHTIQKVSKIVKQLGYKPNILARTLAINKFFRIVLLIPDWKENEYWEQVFKGAQNFISKSKQQGLDIELYFYSAEGKSSFEKIGQKILQSQPDGVIMIPVFLNEGRSFYEQCCNLSIPVIMFDTNIPEIKPLSYIGIDSYQSGRVAAELLTMTDHKMGKFAILHFSEELANAPHLLEREKGFISFLKEECPDREYLVRCLDNQNHYKEELKGILEKDNISSIFVSTSKAYRIGSYLQDEKNPSVTLIGYDLTSQNIRLLKRGY